VLDNAAAVGAGKNIGMKRRGFHHVDMDIDVRSYDDMSIYQVMALSIIHFDNHVCANQQSLQLKTG
jgi:hypothetical protein